MKPKRKGEELLDSIENQKLKLEYDTYTYDKSKSKVNAKTMNNDLAMLNTNTGFTRETVIITDSIG